MVQPKCGLHASVDLGGMLLDVAVQFRGLVGSGARLVEAVKKGGLDFACIWAVLDFREVS